MLTAAALDIIKDLTPDELTDLKDLTPEQRQGILSSVYTELRTELLSSYKDVPALLMESLSKMTSQQREELLKSTQDTLESNQNNYPLKDQENKLATLIIATEMNIALDASNSDQIESVLQKLMIVSDALNSHTLRSEQRLAIRVSLNETLKQLSRKEALKILAATYEENANETAILMTQINKLPPEERKSILEIVYTPYDESAAEIVLRQIDRLSFNEKCQVWNALPTISQGGQTQQPTVAQGANQAQQPTKVGTYGDNFYLRTIEKRNQERRREEG